MTNLADALERFNRKETNLLLRFAVGHSEKHPPLNACFRRNIAIKLAIEGGIPEHAWWAAAYHFDWLAGALRLFADGEAVVGKDWPNPVNPDPDTPATTNQTKRSHSLIQGNQEDIDLIIAFDTTLIMIEAKGYGYLGSGQAARKARRLQLLYEHAGKVSSGTRRVSLHFLLISPTEPQKLLTKWPPWTLINDTIPWLKLPLAAVQTPLQVNRCGPNGKSREGSFWSIVKSSTPGGWVPPKP